MAGLTSVQLDNLMEALRASFESDPEFVTEGEFYYPGGWVAESWEYPQKRADSIAMLLYYPNLVLHDPMASLVFDDSQALPALDSWIARRDVDGGATTITPLTGPEGQQGPTYHALKQERDQLNGILTTKLTALLGMASLIDQEILALADQWSGMAKTRHQIDTAVRHDLANRDLNEWLDARSQQHWTESPLSWDNLRGMDVSFARGFTPGPRAHRFRHQPRFLYLEKTLMMSRASGAFYAPDELADHEFAVLKGNLMLSKSPMEAQLLTRATDVLLPGVGLTPDTAVRMRKDDEAFAEWRSALRNLRRATQGVAPEELREAVRDELSPAVRRVESRTRDKSFTDITAVAAPLGVSTVVSLAGGPPMAAAVVAGTVASAAAYLFWPPQHQGADKVLATLIRARDRG